MTDLDSRLRHSAGTEPRREVSGSFTDRTMARILTEQRQTVFGRAASRIKRSIPMKIRHIKHVGAMASIFAVLLVGGTTYAALRWQGNEGTADYGGITTLANGNTRFWVHAHDCADEQGKQYFDIKAGSKITPAQISDMVAGTCENLDITSVFPGIALNGTAPKGIDITQPGGYQKALESAEINTQYYLTTGVVSKVAHTSITLNIPGHGTTTLPINTNAKIFALGEPVARQSIKKGQPVALVLQAQATFADMQPHANYISLLPGSSVYGIELTHHEFYDTADEGKEFTRLVPNPSIKGPTGKDNPAVIKFYQDPKNLIEEHPLH
ncbi:MAG TPA: hypothetical protein VLG11_02020 [Candidatus Saccharimonadales bacterium]|nr:hypothetical protein [Candidatus Saccharimonadales bacterium]